MSAREIDPVDIDPELSSARRNFDRATREMWWHEHKVTKARREAEHAAKRRAAEEQAKAARDAVLAAQQQRITRAVLPPAAAVWVLCLLGAVAAIAGWP
jgi:hypothetical protein